MWKSAIQKNLNSKADLSRQNQRSSARAQARFGGFPRVEGRGMQVILLIDSINGYNGRQHENLEMGFSRL